MAQSEAPISQPAGLVRLRNRALEELAKYPALSASQELWRQTKPEQFSFKRLPEAVAANFGLLEFGSRRPSNPAGVELITDLEALEQALEELVFGRGSETAQDGVGWLQLASVSSICLLRVAANTQLTEPIVLSQMLESKGDSSAPLILVEVGPGASVVLMEEPDMPGALLYAPRVEVSLRENSRLEFVSVQRLAPGAQYLARHRFQLDRDASLHTVHVCLGAGVARLDLDCRLYQEGASAQLDSLYLADGDRHVDFHLTQEHLAPHCSSNLYCKGVLKDSSRGVYYGLIKVAEGAQKTDAYQKNRNLLLSSEARADAIPKLEIKANDVRCSHGATVGQVGPEEMFYLMTRGVTEAEAQRLLVEGFFEDLLAREKNAGIHDYLQRLVMEALERGSNRS
jgi:Fe-S cluster assembly protein SufD